MPAWAGTAAARPPLFDRLAGDAATGQAKPRAQNGQGDGAGFRQSLQRELGDLLSTRAPLPIAALEQRPQRTAIDYGVPDLSAFPAGEHAAMQRLAAHMAAAIAAYEPRLRDVKVELLPDPACASAMIVIVQATHLRDRHPVPLVLHFAPGTAPGLVPESADAV